MKFEKETEKKLTATINELITSGKHQIEIAQALNDNGPKTASGVPWTRQNVANFIRVRRRKILALAGTKRRRNRISIKKMVREKNGRDPVTTPVRGGGASVSRTAILSLATDPNLNAVQFRKVLVAYLEA